MGNRIKMKGAGAHTFGTTARARQNTVMPNQSQSMVQ